MLKKFSRLLRNLRSMCNTLIIPREFYTQRGQGIVEYGLIIGFVAVIAIFILNGSGLKENVDKNITNANTVASTMDSEYKKAAGIATTGPIGGGEVVIDEGDENE